MNIEIFSVGGYSSWCYYAPDRILFDCGEGFATNLRNRVFAVEKVFILESHADHLSGLQQFLAARDSARGDKDKSLEIYCDPNNKHIQKLIEYLQFTNFRAFRDGKTQFKQLGDIDLGNNRYVHVFPVKHSPKFACYGAVIREKRTRLKEKYRGADIKAGIASGTINKNDLNEEYIANVFAYTLDSSDFDKEEIRGANHWVADSCFINEDDMDGDSTHMFLGKALEYGKAANVKNIYLAHFSSRYNNDQIKNLKLPDGVFPVLHGRVNRFD